MKTLLTITFPGDPGLGFQFSFSPALCPQLILDYI